MARKVWDGSAADNDWTTAANWTPAVVPAAGDDVYFIGAVTNEECTANCNPAVALNSLRIASDYTGNVGNSGVGTKLAPTSIGQLVIEGSGNYYVDTTVATAHIRSSGTVEIDGTYDDLMLYQGSITTVSGCTAPRVFIAHNGRMILDASVTIASGTVLNHVTVLGGSTECSAEIPNLWALAGEVVQLEGDIGYCYVGGGIVNFLSDGDTYEATLVDCYRGTFKTVDDPYPKTIGHIIVWPDAVADFRNGMNNLIAAAADIVNMGGKIYFDEGQELTV